jgi:hypothetical protein
MTPAAFLKKRGDQKEIDLSPLGRLPVSRPSTAWARFLGSERLLSDQRVKCIADAQ